MKASDLTLGRIPYGTVYLIDPELTLQEKRRDLTHISALGFNTVVLWPAVSRWDGDPPGSTAFDSVDDAMDLCAELDLMAILELQGQNTSFQEAPECYELPLEALGDGPRDIRFNHPEYLRRTLAYFKEVAEHFKGHPALLAYDIFNEIGNNSTDPATVAEFITFLRDRYGDDIRVLNAAWGSFFGDFDGIAKIKPRWSQWRWSSAVAGRDWHRFRGQNFVDRMDDWAAAIRDVDSDVVILADILGCDTMHNRASGYFGVHDWEVTDHVDVLGLSCYGNMLGERWWEVDSWRWAQWWRSALSAARGKQAMISEMMTQHRTMFPWEASSMTDQIELWSYQAIFHGIKGLIYWKYRPFRRGLQVSGRGLTDFDAIPNEYGEQAARVAAFVERHADQLAGATPDAAGCAILHDHNTQTIYESIQNRSPDFYTDAHGGIFKGFWSQSISPMYLRADDLAGGVPEWVRILAVPCNVSVSQATADALAAFLDRGGRLLTESRFALLDEDARLWPHVPGGGLAAKLGIEERNFTSRFCDALPIGSDAVTFENDFLQYLTMAEDVRILCETVRDVPAATTRKIGPGLHAHAAFNLGEKIHRGDVGAMEVFGQLWEKLVSAATPAVAVISKPALADVSVLLDTKCRPFMVGITNYDRAPAKVVLHWTQPPLGIEGDDNARADMVDEQLDITVSPRQAAAVFL